MFVFQIDGNKREEWMTELPPAQAANLGLGPRKFRLRDGPDMSDRSCWTDTPAQKAQKQMDSVNIINALPCVSGLNCKCEAFHQAFRI